jgi:hypothetical protein
LNRRVRWTLATLIAVLAAAVLAACGDSTPGHTPVTPASNFYSPEDGIAFRAPKGATVDRGKAEQVVVLRRGESTLTITRFPRPGENLPNSHKEFRRASRVLPLEYQKRFPSSHGRSLVETVAGHQAVLVNVEDSDRTMEHIHFYEHGAEVVVDMVSPHTDFERAKAILFDPVLTSLKITKPRISGA